MMFPIPSRQHPHLGRQVSHGVHFLHCRFQRQQFIGQPAGTVAVAVPLVAVYLVHARDELGQFASAHVLADNAAADPFDSVVVPAFPCHVCATLPCLPRLTVQRNVTLDQYDAEREGIP